MKNLTYYQSRIHAALDYMNQNLDENIKIEHLAEASHFSSFHFQRIYKALMDETPYETLLRIRLEKAVFLLKYRTHLPLFDIAIACGFSSYENFSRQFKKRYKISPSSFKKSEDFQHSRIYQEDHTKDFYHRIEMSRKAPKKDFTVFLEELPSIEIAFVRAVFGADGTGLIERYQDLIAWADAKQIPYRGELKRFGMSIDSVEVTPASKFRYDFALTIEKKYAKEDLIEFGSIPAGTYATVHCMGKLEEVAQGWDYLYKIWLPQSGYQPKHYPAIEEFVQGPEEIGWDNFNIKCRIPIIHI